MGTSPSRRRFPAFFFVVVFLTAVPFWLLQGLTGLRTPLVNLPISAFAIFCPAIAALASVYREGGWPGVKRLLQRVFDFQKIRRGAWYLPILLLMPAVIYADYGLTRLLGLPVPGLEFPVLAVLTSFVVFFAAGILEELGWTGYAIDRLQAWFGNALAAAIFLGVFWAVWHIIPWLPGHGAAWVAGKAVGTVALRIIIVWLYGNTGSLLAAVLFHAVANISELVLFPIRGSYYNPVISSVLLVLAVMVIVYFWGPKTLVRFRYTRRQGSPMTASRREQPLDSPKGEDER